MPRKKQLKSCIKKPEMNENSKYYEFSLTKGKPIARIEGGELDGETLYITDRGDDNGVFTFQLTNPKSRFVPLNPKQMGSWPNRVTIGGSSLCGKSYFGGNFLAKDYRRKFPKNRIYIFSNINEDEAYDDLGGVYRIPLDNELLDEPIQHEELANSMVIFDDYASHPDKNIVKAVEHLRDSCFNSGRHHNIWPVTISQVMLDGKKSRDGLLNSFQIVIFPQSGGKYQANNFMERYMSMPKDLIHQINELPSRWVVLNRVRPLHYLSEHQASMI